MTPDRKPLESERERQQTDDGEPRHESRARIGDKLWPCATGEVHRQQNEKDNANNDPHFPHCQQLYLAEVTFCQPTRNLMTFMSEMLGRRSLRLDDLRD